jgi:hypothetical protein
VKVELLLPKFNPMNIFATWKKKHTKEINKFIMGTKLLKFLGTIVFHIILETKGYNWLCNRIGYFAIKTILKFHMLGWIPFFLNRKSTLVA